MNEESTETSTHSVQSSMHGVLPRWTTTRWPNLASLGVWSSPCTDSTPKCSMTTARSLSIRSKGPAKGRGTTDRYMARVQRADIDQFLGFQLRRSNLLPKDIAMRDIRDKGKMGKVAQVRSGRA